MPLIEIDERETWESFLSTQPWAPFTQSWAWGEFQRSQGHAVRRFFLSSDSDSGASRFTLHPSPLLACQLIHYERSFSGYWFAPRGPVFSKSGLRDPGAVFRTLLEELKKADLSRRSLFYRFEPALTLEQSRGVLPPVLVRTHAMNPAATIVADLTKSEQELLAAMHPKTRYNIRVAERHGVSVREGNLDDLGSFLALTAETAARDRFTSQALTYLRATFEALSGEGLARVRLAEFQGGVLAANLEIAYGDTVTYLHGASSSKERQAMAPHLLQWEAMRAAKSAGFRRYDFWGANPVSQDSYYYKSSWEGITRFKEGFGGTRIELAGTWDLPMKRLLYRLAFAGR